MELITCVHELEQDGTGASYKKVIKRLWPGEWQAASEKIAFETAKWDLLRKRRRKIVVRRPWLRLLASRIRFEHDQAGFAERVEIWTFRPSEVISGRQAMGYGSLL
jgi:hypothetical protein